MLAVRVYSGVLHVFARQDRCIVGEGELQLSCLAYLLNGLIGVLDARHLYAEPLGALDADSRFGNAHGVYTPFQHRPGLFHQRRQFGSSGIRIGLHDDVNTAVDVQAEFHYVLNRIDTAGTVDCDEPSDYYYDYDQAG